MSTLLFFLSLALLRFREFQLLQSSLDDAIHVGLITGVLADIALTFVPLAVGRMASSLVPVAIKPVCAITMALIWSILAANVCYFTFFQSQLHLFVLWSYAENAWSVRSVALQLLQNPMILLSLGLLGLSMLILLRHKLRLSITAPSALFRLGSGGVVLCAALLIRQVPVWTHLPRISESLLSDNIVWQWADEFKQGEIQTRLPLARYSAILPRARAILQHYKVMETGRTTASSTSETHQLRKLLGFPQSKPVNVVILFLESARGYEFLKPGISHDLYPNLKRVLSKHGVLFKQAYSSAEFTVQGQFSTLCSRMDRMDAGPVYARQPYLKIDCLPSVLKNAGYETYWMNPYHRFFSGKFLFESNHGTMHFLDRDEFKATTAQERLNESEWGISDDQFLLQAFRRLQEIHRKGKPFFSHLLTTGTHAPWHPLTGYRLSPSILLQTQSSPDYLAYLSSIKALDHAVGNFFEQFFKSPMSEDTAVIVLADHGIGITPSDRISPLQQNLLKSRIILGVISKHIRQPRIVEYPVHQMDVAPLISTLVGTPIPESWLGREPLLSQSGTPWVKRQGAGVAYRTKKRICSQAQTAGSMTCLLLTPETDPLFESHLGLIPEDKNETDLFRSIIDANEATLELGAN